MPVPELDNGAQAALKAMRLKMARQAFNTHIVRLTAFAVGTVIAITSAYIAGGAPVAWIVVGLVMILFAA